VAQAAQEERHGRAEDGGRERDEDMDGGEGDACD
jgi:hypothetical protein